MLAQGTGGAIVNWSSVGGLNATPYTGIYAAAKGFVSTVTRGPAAVNFVRAWRGVLQSNPTAQLPAIPAISL